MGEVGGVPVWVLIAIGALIATMPLVGWLMTRAQRRAVERDGKERMWAQVRELLKR